MKNWQITGFLAILIIGIVLTSGCTSTGSTSTATSTPTPQIVYVTVLVTPTETLPVTAKAAGPTTQVPIVTTLTTSVTARGRSLGSVAGAWAYNDGIKIKINSDGTTLDNIDDSWSTGTWRFESDNKFIVNSVNGKTSGEWVYSTDNNTIYQIEHPELIYHLYSGTIEKFCPNDPKMTYNMCMGILSHSSYTP